MRETPSTINNRRGSSALATFYEIISTSNYSKVSALVLLFGTPLIEGDHQDMFFFIGSTVLVNSPSDYKIALDDNSNRIISTYPSVWDHHQH
jgi:hypothetical protein